MSTPPGGQPPYDPNQPPYGNQPPPPPPPPPGGYDPSAPGGYGQPSQPATNGLAITSLVLGILGLLGLCFCFGGILSPVALVLGHLGKKKADQSNGAIGGRGMAKAGFILGIIGTILFVILVVWFIVALATGGDFNYQYGTDMG